jgi:hypothetical protein
MATAEVRAKARKLMAQKQMRGVINGSSLEALKESFALVDVDKSGLCLTLCALCFTVEG